MTYKFSKLDQTDLVYVLSSAALCKQNLESLCLLVIIYDTMVNTKWQTAFNHWRKHASKIYAGHIHGCLVNSLTITEKRQ